MSANKSWKSYLADPLKWEFSEWQWGGRLMGVLATVIMARMICRADTIALDGARAAEAKVHQE